MTGASDHPLGGRYLDQPSGYRCWMPGPLPPSNLDVEGLARALESASRQVGRLDGLCETTATHDRLAVMFVRQEAVLSAQIEGTQASLEDVLAAEAQELQHPDNDMAEAIQSVAASRLAMQRLTDQPITTALLRDLHTVLLRGTRGQQYAGLIRTTQNWVGRPGGVIQEAAHIPPPPEALPEYLQEFELFLTDRRLPDLLVIGLAHAHFETLHPFSDGNGRLGRLLIALLMVRRGLLRVPLLPVSLYFKQFRREYFDLLQGTRENGDWTAWMQFFLRAVEQSAHSASARLSALATLVADHRQRLLATTRSTTAIVLLDHLQRQPIITLDSATTAAAVTPSAAQRTIDHLVKLGLLNEVTGFKRNRRWAYAPYLAFFAEGEQTRR